MTLFERYLSVWVFLCILLGIFLGHWFPSFFTQIAQLEIAQVNVIIAVLIGMMIIPMMANINFKSLISMKPYAPSLFITLFVCWAVAPFSMAFFAWIFLKLGFSSLLSLEHRDHYIAGLILLGTAPCTAMVFVWSRLTGGNPSFTLSQVALNDVLMIFLFAPIVQFLLGIHEIFIPIRTMVFSVLIFILIPLLLGQGLRGLRNPLLLKYLNSFSMVALLMTLVILFALQGSSILNHPFDMGLIAIPIIVQVFFIAMIAYALNRYFKQNFEVMAPSVLIGTSNFFELAVATAISLFGTESRAVLATVVGVLIEVPMMLFLVKVLNQHKNTYQKIIAKH